MIKAAFFDIDWTLYDHNSNKFISSSLLSIKRLQEQGIKVFVCSARNTKSLYEFGVFSLGINWDGFISSAGAFACLNNKVVTRKLLMKKEDVCNLVSFVLKRNLTMQIVTPWDRFLINKPDEYYSLYQEVFHDECKEIHQYKDEEVLGTLLYAPSTLDEELAKEFPNLVRFRFATYGIDINGGEHNKGDGINSILSYFNIKKEEAISFGDDIQDISMSDATGIFVCMGNGKDEVKKVANYVTSDVASDGVTKALLHFKILR